MTTSDTRPKLIRVRPARVHRHLRTCERWAGAQIQELGSRCLKAEAEIELATDSAASDILPCRRVICQACRAALALHFCSREFPPLGPQPRNRRVDLVWQLDDKVLIRPGLCGFSCMGRVAVEWGLDGPVCLQIVPKFAHQVCARPGVHYSP
jgi:hypothetical protein